MFCQLTVTCRGLNEILEGPKPFSAVTNHLSCIKSFGYAQSLANHHSSYNSLEIWDLKPQKVKKCTSRSEAVGVEWGIEPLSGVTCSESTAKRLVLHNTWQNLSDTFQCHCLIL
jgi:hypothetical protein